MKKIVMLVKKVQERKSGQNLAPSLHNRRYLFACFSRANASNHAWNTGYFFPEFSSILWERTLGTKVFGTFIRPDSSLSNFLLLFCYRTVLRAFFLILLCPFTDSRSSTARRSNSESVVLGKTVRQFF